MKNKFKSALCFLLALTMTAPAVYATEDDKNLAYADFTGKNPITSNMSVYMENSAPDVGEKEGRKGWILSNDQDDLYYYEFNAPEATINIDLDNAFAYKLEDGSTYEIEVDYYDEGQAVFSLVYSAQDRSNRYAGMQKTEGSGAKGVFNKSISAWRTKTFLIQDAKFDNSLYEYDFKISASILNQNHDIKEGQDSGFGRGYSKFYPNRQARVSTKDDILIGAIRVKKLDKINPFAGKITSEAIGNNFFDDEPVKLDIKLENKTNKPYELNAKYYAVNDDGIIASEMTDTVSIGANETKDFSVVQKDLPYGIFTYYAEFSADDNIFYRLTTDVARVREPKVPNPRAGTNIHTEGADTYPVSIDEILILAKRCGYKSLRESTRWPEHETTPGQYIMRNTTQYTIEAFKRLGLREHGMDYMPVMFMNNTLYIKTPDDIMTPQFQEAYYNYMLWYTKQFMEISDAFEQQNEINHIYPTITGEQYGKLMEIMYKAVKSVNPDIKVVGVDTGLLDLALVRRFFEGGTLDWLDVVSWHPYSWSKPVEQGSQFTGAPSVQALMEEFGHGDREKWVTESGWYVGFGNPCSYEDKTYYYPRAILMNDALKVYEMFHFYEFLDGGIQPNFGETAYGTLKSEWGETPFAAHGSYVSTANVNWLLQNAEFDTTINGEPSLTDNTYVYRWKRDNSDGRGKHMLALWTCNDPIEYGLKLNKDEVLAIDIYGNESTLKAVDGVFNFVLNDRPVYLIGDFDYMQEAEPTVKVSTLNATGTANDTIVLEVSGNGLDNAKIVQKNADFTPVENEGFKDGKAKYTLTTPDRRFYNKKIKFNVTDDDKLVLAAVVKVNNDKTVTIKEEHRMSDTNSTNRWEMELFVTNNMNKGPIDGTITIKAPAEVAKYISGIPFKNLAPQETFRYKLFMPEIITKEMRKYNVEVNLSTGEKLSDAHTMFFTSVPYAYNKPTIDAVVSNGEYRTDTWFPIEGAENVKLLNADASYAGNADLSGKATAIYDEENIYFIIEIEDDMFVQNKTGEQIWNGDSIQIGLADETTQSAGAYAELTVALTKEGPQMYRHLSNTASNPTGLVENCEIAIERRGTKTYYELKIPWSEALQKPELVKPGYVPKFAFLINDDDGYGRNKFMEYSQVLGAIGTDKNVGYFSDMHLADK